MEKALGNPKQIKSRNRSLAAACVVFAHLCVFLPAAFWKGGVLEGEAITFVINHTDDRTPLQKIFSPRHNDFNTYQARELSFLFDYLDANFYLFLLRKFDVAFFIPLSAIVSSLLIIFIYRRGVRRTLPGIDRLTGELSLLPFLTCFVFVSSMGLFYRSGKPLLAPVVLALLFHIFRTAQSRVRGSIEENGWGMVNRRSLITLGLLFVAALFDRQGYFYVLIAFSVLLLHFLLTRKLKDLLIAAAAAAVLGHLWNIVLGPAIIWAVNYEPADFSYQRIPKEELANLPVHSLRATRLLLANVATMLGGYYVIGYLVVATITGWLIWRAIIFHKRQTPGKLRERYTSGESLAVIYALLVLALQIVMFALMNARHPYIYAWVDHWYWYYPLPFLMTALFGLALLLNALLPRLGALARRSARVALVVIVASNLLHLPDYRKLMLSSHWFGPIYGLSEALKASIGDRSPRPDLGTEFTRFFLFHEKQRKPPK